MLTIFNLSESFISASHKHTKLKFVYDIGSRLTICKHSVSLGRKLANFILSCREFD